MPHRTSSSSRLKRKRSQKRKSTPFLSTRLWRWWRRATSTSTNVRSPPRGKIPQIRCQVSTDITKSIGSRRLLTYRRLRDAEISVDALAAYHVQRLELQEANPTGVGGTANDLNDFRKKVCQNKCRLLPANSGFANVDFLKCSISKDSVRLNSREMRYEIYEYGVYQGRMLDTRRTRLFLPRLPPSPESTFTQCTYVQPV
jgi:hypothetical protein